MPCRAMEPVLEQVGLDLADQLKIVKIDAEVEMELSSRFGIQSVPNLLLFKSGEVVAQRVGSTTKGLLLSWLGEQGVGKVK